MLGKHTRVFLPHSKQTDLWRRASDTSIMSSNDNKASGADDRFSKVKRDPRFWEMPEKERKIKIDSRFKSMFTDKRFKVKYTVDKRGRPINHTSSDDLKRFYNISDTDDDDEEEASSGTKEVKKKVKKEKKKEVKKEKKKKEEEEEEEEESGGVTADLCETVKETDIQVKGQTALPGVRVVEEGDGDDDELSVEEEAEQRDGVTGSGDDDEDDEDDEDSEASDDLARGFGNVETSSDEDEEEGEGEEEEQDVEAVLRREEEQITHDWGELCKDAARSDQVSSRLAVCNMNWDRIKAKDLLMVFNSFKPKGGVVISVKIYPSEFGKERRELERSQGPMTMMNLPEDPELDTHEQQVYRETLRDYQFKRLKYFYAVVECDSSLTADTIYQSCDRSEYESSCSVIDLRFIPDDVSFEGEEPTDIATDVGVAAYTPKMFICAASGTSTVKLTWDENDHDRVTALSRDFKKDALMDMDFNAYLASSSDEEGEGPAGEWEWPAGEGKGPAKAEEGPGGEGEGPGGEGEGPVGEGEGPVGEGEGPGTGGAESEEKEKGVTETKEEVVRPRQKKQRAEQQIQKYRELLKGIQDKEKKSEKHMEMEITWTPGLRQTTEQLVQKKQQAEVKGQLTPWEVYLEKKKSKKRLRRHKKTQVGTEEDLSDDDVPSDVDLNDPFFAEELGGASEVKKKKTMKTKGKKGKKEEEERTAEEDAELESRKAEMALLMDEPEDGQHKHFNYDDIVEKQNLSKKKRKHLEKNDQPLEEDQFQVDVSDPRFQAVYTSALFNLDPSDPHYKKTRATQSLLAEKRRRRAHEGEGPHQATPPTSQEAPGGGRKQDTDGGKQEGVADAGLSLLVKSIKSKTQQFHNRKMQKTT